LQLEVELTAEAFSQRQSPGLVDAAAERCVQHQLHAARLVEEALEHERLLRWKGAKLRARVGHVSDGLGGGVGAGAGLGLEPGGNGRQSRGSLWRQTFRFVWVRHT